MVWKEGRRLPIAHATAELVTPNLSIKNLVPLILINHQVVLSTFSGSGFLAVLPDSTSRPEITGLCCTWLRSLTEFNSTGR